MHVLKCYYEIKIRIFKSSVKKFEMLQILCNFLVYYENRHFILKTSFAIYALSLDESLML